MIILVLIYMNCSTLLKFCQRRTSDSADKTTNSSINAPTLTTMSPPISSTTLNSPQDGLDDLTPTPEKSPALPLVFASITLHDASASQEKSYVVLITITNKQKSIAILFQNDHILWSALIDTGSPVTLFSEKLT